MNIRFFGNIDLNEEYYETDINLLDKKISLDLNLEEVLGKKDWILKYDDYVSKLLNYKEKIEKKLNEDFDDWGVTKEWIDWHIEELDKDTIEKLVKDADLNMQLDEKLLTRVNLVRIGFYPGYEDYAIWDFMLDEKISDQILVVVTDNNGEILDITWES